MKDVLDTSQSPSSGKTNLS